jgi:hypothetical protein
VPETLAYYAFPEEHWRRIRTNNPLERIMREIRRRTRKRLKPGGRIAIFDIIHSRKAVLRMMGLGRHRDVPSGFEIVMRCGVVFARWAAWPLIAKENRWSVSQ